MRQPVKYATKRRSEVKSFAAPTGGWIANRNLAIPNGQQSAPGAYVLENYFPTSRSAKMRRGSQLYATLGLGDLPVTAMFSYIVGAQEEFFASTEETIYDITSIVSPINYELGSDTGDIFETDLGFTFGEQSTVGLEVVIDQVGGDWVTVQFATSGGVFLVLVNGTDHMRVYDGSVWYPITSSVLSKLSFDTGIFPFATGDTVTGAISGASAPILAVTGNIVIGDLYIGTVTGGPFQDNETITGAIDGSAVADGTTSLVFGSFTNVDTDKLDYVWAYKNRLFFIEKESLSAWYLPVDSLVGAAAEIPLGGVFSLGGSLLFGSSWSLDSGSGGAGLSEQCVFVTTEGEVAVFQGSNPGDPADWSLVNTYRIGRPLGKRAHIRAGGDLVIATTIGAVPLSQAVQRDYAALSPSAVSYPIEDAWNEAVLNRTGSPWTCAVWPSAQMVLVAPPTVNDQPPVIYVANSRTGAWAPFTNWDATCLLVFKERCFYGSADGKVVEANVTGMDQGTPYTATYVPLFDDISSPASLKIAKMARPVLRSAVPVAEQVSLQADFQVTLPPNPDAAAQADTSAWGVGVWGESVWGREGLVNTYQNWRVIFGNGYAIAPAIQITSGSAVPLDTEVVRFDLAVEFSDQMT